MPDDDVDGDVRDVGSHPHQGKTRIEIRAAVAERRAKALTMRRKGSHLAVIARECGYKTEHAVSVDIARALRSTVAVPADELRALELERLDDIQEGHWDAAVGGDPRSALVVLKVMERRHKLLGLDAPQKVDMSGLIREIAEREGLPYDFAVSVANDIIRAAAAGN